MFLNRPVMRVGQSALLLVLTALRLSAQSSATPDPLATLRASARLVVVDVVVEDAHGDPVKGLRQTDFTLTEAKADQTLRAFEEHSAPALTRIVPAPAMPPGVFTNFTPAPANSAVNVLLLDLLNTPMQDQTYVRAQLLKFLQTAKPGVRIAIFTLTDRLRMLQAFTSEPELLLRAISKTTAKASPLIANPGGSGAPPELSEQYSVNSASAGLTIDPAILANLADFEAENRSFQITSRSLDTLTAMNQLARYLTGIPGRKNLLWFSASFPTEILPDADAKGSAFAGQASTANALHETTNLLARAQVAVYPIDALGIRTSEAFRASAGDSSRDGGDGFHAAQASLEARTFANDTYDAHQTMTQLAEDTGGKAFLNGNGLAEAAAAAISNGSNFYTLSYTPSNAADNGAFRPIRVRVDRPGVKLFYRHGYYAEPPASTKSAIAPATPGTLRTGALFGGPPATPILIKALVQSAGTQPDSKPAEGNSPVGKSRGSWTRYAVNIAADTHTMSFTPAPDGHLRDSIQCVTFVYTLDGTLVNSVLSTIQADVSPADYQALLRGGLHVSQQVSVPVKGAFALRIVVHDLGGDRVGSLELPLSAIPNQPVAAAPAPAAQPDHRPPYNQP